MKPLLSAENVSFAYHRRRVLQNVSLMIGAGEFVGVIGANGSGKTTLLRMLLGLLPAATGAVRLGGSLLGSLTRREIALRATMVQQETRIDFAFTGREIVAMGRTPYLGRFKPETLADKEAIELAMRQTETEDFAERFVTELSGGERQRIHLARALAQNTQVILLDEPTANLDLTHQFEALHLIKKATGQGKAALAAIHDLALAARFCDRLLLLADGSIVAAGPPAEVITEGNLSRFFHLDARVRRDEATDGLVISPLGADKESRRQEDKETRGQTPGEAKSQAGEESPSPPSVSLSPCLPVSLSPCLLLIAVLGIVIGVIEAAHPFPREPNDAADETLLIAGRPQRIVSQTLGTDEILLAICSPDRIVALSSLAENENYSNVFAEAGRVAGRTTQDVEQILQLEPDLIFVAGYSRAEIVQLLKASGGPVFRFANFNSIADIKSNIRKVGYAVGNNQEAEALIRQMNETLAAVRARVPPDRTPFRVMSFDPSGCTAGAKTIFDDMVRAAGAINVSAENRIEGIAPISTEKIIEWQPDFIVAGANQGEIESVRRNLLADPVIKASRAGLAGRIILIDNRHFLTVSHYVVRGVEDLADGLYGRMKEEG